MTTTTAFRTTAAAIGVGALLAGGIAAGQAFGATSTTSTATTAATATAIDAQTAAALSFARDEERMARDLYAAIAERYDGARPFSMITNSEQQHFEAIGTLLERYGISDPASGMKAGEYKDQAIQKLYDDWWAQAQKSLDEAYQVGIALEQRDIADLDSTIAAGALPSDVETVLGHLLQASRQHLAAFQAAADGTFAAGTGRANGYGNGYGMRNGGRWGNGSGPGMMNGAGYGPGTGDCPFLDDSSTTT